MHALPDPRWGALLFFGALAAHFFYSALARRASRSWGWGRSGQAGPISRLGYGVIGSLFLCLTFLLGLRWDSPPRALIGWFIANLATLFVVGLVDSRRNQAGQGR